MRAAREKRGLGAPGEKRRRKWWSEWHRPPENYEFSRFWLRADGSKVRRLRSDRWIRPLQWSDPRAPYGHSRGALGGVLGEVIPGGAVAAQRMGALTFPVIPSGRRASEPRAGSYRGLRMSERLAIVVKPKSHRRFSDADLAPLLKGLDDVGPRVQLVREDPDPRKIGVTWWEVIEVHLRPVAQIGAAAAAGALLKDVARDFAKDGVKKVAEQIASVFVTWAKDRARKTTHRAAPPKHVTIYGPDGRPVLRVTVDDPNEPPKIEE